MHTGTYDHCDGRLYRTLPTEGPRCLNLMDAKYAYELKKNLYPLQAEFGQVRECPSVFTTNYVQSWPFAFD